MIHRATGRDDAVGHVLLGPCAAGAGLKLRPGHQMMAVEELVLIWSAGVAFVGAGAIEAPIPPDAPVTIAVRPDSLA
jgi:hypothetical protein